LDFDSEPYEIFLSILKYGCIVWYFRKMEEQKPKEQRPKASENKPAMTE
jgi:hypothetical protein